MTDLSFLDEDTLRAVEAYAKTKACTQEEAVNAILKGAIWGRSAGKTAMSEAVRGHLAQHRGLGLKCPDNGGEVA